MSVPDSMWKSLKVFEFALGKNKFCNDNITFFMAKQKFIGRKRKFINRNAKNL